MDFRRVRINGENIERGRGNAKLPVRLHSITGSKNFIFTLVLIFLDAIHFPLAGYLDVVRSSYSLVCSYILTCSLH